MAKVRRSSRVGSDPLSRSLAGSVKRLAQTPAQVFISHNKADKEFARRLAFALVEQGISVWFDEWRLRLGDSIPAGIEHGLSSSDVVIVVWSRNAVTSRWVKAELESTVYRCISDGSVRVIPVMLDDTALPALIAHHLGVRVGKASDVLSVAAQIAGDDKPAQLARRLQDRFFEILDQIGEGAGLTQYHFCPRCGSSKLKGWEQTDFANDRMYAGIRCEQCGWNDGDEL